MADKNKLDEMDNSNVCDNSKPELKAVGPEVKIDFKTLSNETQNIQDSFKVPGLPVIPQSKHDTTKTPIDNTDKVTTADPKEDNVKCDEKNIYKESSSKTTKLTNEKHLEEISNDRSKNQSTSKKSTLSPAEQLKQTQVVIPYKEPGWSGLPGEKYSFDVLKNGTIVSTIDLEKPYYVFGRLPSCDVTMDHPSLSRYHAVIQYCKNTEEGREKGWYLYDLDSTHGTWINKHKTYPNKYYRIRVGHMVKFGGSTRLHILQGPDEDTEEESDLTPTEMKEQRDRQKKEAEILRQAEIAAEERKLEELKRIEEARGCSWGMGDDAADEEDEGEKGESVMEHALNILTPESEALYINDPKKALKGYFEREGCEEPEYEVVEAGKGKYKCTVELPVDTAAGEPMVAEAVVSGKKKDAVVQCALEACRMLDRQGLLRASKHESRKKKKKNWADDDYYDSDDDIYLDRTGDIEKKRKQRMNKAGKSEEATQTYDMLIEKHQNIVQEIQEIETKLDKAKAEAAAAMTEGEVDALDAYMSAIKSGMMDTKTKMKLKRQLMELKQEEQKTRKLVNIAKPAMLPELKRPDPSLTKKADVKGLPAFGKIKSLQKVNKKTSAPVNIPMRFDNNKMKDMEEEEEEEEEDEKAISKDELNTKIQDSDVKQGLSAAKSVIVTVNKSSEVKDSDRSDGSQPKQQRAARPEMLEDDKDVTESVQTSMCGTVLSRTHNNVNTTDEISDVSQRVKESEVTDLQTPQVKRQHKTESTDRKSKKRKPDLDQVGGTYDSTDPDYAVWVPPSNQSGDGKTHLNDKFGY
ncbi:kanadaptin-like [Ylistrum balloti]|uniref:kanadaptin-like n=1 Tax=Ylistrum balloti TaxID=509963 RepID=UPI002905CD29|nr:kanadaptin-like [Ylistrum balloti]